MSITNFKNKVVIITGAGSGMGRALALELNTLGAKLALCDVNDAALTQTIELLSPTPAFSATFDIADAENVAQFINDTISHFDHIDALINNAGIGMGEQRMQDMPLEQFKQLMDINFWGTVYGCHYALPHLINRPNSALINISSSFGLIAGKYAAAYSASKFAINGLTQSLITENYANALSIHTVFPGGIKTNISKNSLNSELRSANFEKNLKTSPEKAAKVIINGILKNEQRIKIGNDAKLLELFSRAMPSTALKVINQFFVKKTLKKIV